MNIFIGWSLPPAISANRTPNMFFITSMSKMCRPLWSAWWLAATSSRRAQANNCRIINRNARREVEEPVAVNVEENNDCLKIKRKSRSLLPLLPRQGGGERHPAGRPGHVQSYQVKKHHLFKNTRARDRKFEVQYWKRREYHEATGFRVGFKPAGGIRTAKDAIAWLVLIKVHSKNAIFVWLSHFIWMSFMTTYFQEELGNSWLNNKMFRWH